MFLGPTNLKEKRHSETHQQTPRNQPKKQQIRIRTQTNQGHKKASLRDLKSRNLLIINTYNIIKDLKTISIFERQNNESHQRTVAILQTATITTVTEKK